MPPIDLNQISNTPATSRDIGALINAIGGGNFPWWYPVAAQNLAVDYFVYVTDFLPLGASASTTNPIAIDASSAFIVLSAVLVETDTLNTTFLGQRPLLASLQDGGSGRYLSNGPVHVDNWFGTAEEPKYWDVPKILAPNSTFSVTMANQEATARNVRVAFHGLKIFNFKPTYQ